MPPANAHRLFVTQETPGAASPVHNGPSGIVSVVDSSFFLLVKNEGKIVLIFVILLVLSLFARLANVEDIDPTRMQRHRRASSVTSSHSSKSDRDLARSTSRSSTSSRTSSRTGVRQSPNASLASAGDNQRSSISKAEVFQWIERSH